MVVKVRKLPFMALLFTLPIGIILGIMGWCLSFAEEQKDQMQRRYARYIH